jgi:lipopolysaccharide exporter
MVTRHAIDNAGATEPRPGPDAVEPTLGPRVRRGATWSAAATLFLRFSNIIVTTIVAHIFNRGEFGVFTIALTANTIVTIVGQFGLSSCLTRADLDMDSVAPTMLTFSVATNMVQAGAMFFFAGPIATALGSGGAAAPIKVLALAQVIVGFVEVPNCQLLRDFKQNKLFWAQVVGSVPSTAVLLALAWTGAGPVAYAWSLDVGLCLSACVVFASVRRYYRPGFSRAAFLVLVKYGFPLGAANIVSITLLNVDYAFIGHLVGAAALGGYVLAFNIASAPASLFGSALAWVGIPAFSRVRADPAALRQATLSALRAVCLVALPLSALLIALGRPLILSLYGAKWMSSVDVLQVLVLYGAASVICSLCTNILAGLGLSRILFLLQLGWLSALIPAMLIGVRMDGIFGAAVAHVVVIGLCVLPCYLVILKRCAGVRLTALIRSIVPPLAASCAAGLAARAAADGFTLPALQLAAGLAAGALVYLVAAAPLASDLFLRGRTVRPPVAFLLRLHDRARRLLSLPGVPPLLRGGRTVSRLDRESGADTEARS